MATLCFIISKNLLQARYKEVVAVLRIVVQKESFVKLLLRVVIITRLLSYCCGVGAALASFNLIWCRCPWILSELKIRKIRGS